MMIKNETLILEVDNYPDHSKIYNLKYYFKNKYGLEDTESTRGSLNIFDKKYNSGFVYKTKKRPRNYNYTHLITILFNNCGIIINVIDGK